MSESSEILDYLTGIQGAVRPTDPPQLYEVVSRGEDGDVPAVARIHSDAGTMTIYDIKTGEPSLTSLNLLPAQLQKVGPDGRRMFTLTPPVTAPVRGQHKCLLHADDPNQAQYQEWGFPTCPKANLPSAFMVEQHMAKCHKVAWATITQHKAELEKREERARQEQHERNLVAALAGRLAEVGAPAQQEPVASRKK